MFVMYSTLYTAAETTYALLKPFRQLVDKCAIFPAMRAAAKREMSSIPRRILLGWNLCYLGWWWRRLSPIAILSLTLL